MKSRFSVLNLTRLKQITLLCTGLLTLIACQAQTNELDPSTYEAVRTEFPVSTGEKIEVIELFWFKCGACYSLEPSLKRWEAGLPDNVELVKVPAMFGSNWEFEAQAFYTMQALGAAPEVYDDYFDQIHVKRRPVSSADELGAWLENYGFEAEVVTSTFSSFAVDSKLRQAKRIALSSGARSVPTMIVDGKYRTSTQETGSTVALFEVVDQLIEKAAAER